MFLFEKKQYDIFENFYKILNFFKYLKIYKLITIIFKDNSLLKKSFNKFRKKLINKDNVYKNIKNISIKSYLNLFY